MATHKQMVDRAEVIMRQAGEHAYDWQDTLIELGNAFGFDGDSEDMLMDVIREAEERLGWVN